MWLVSVVKQNSEILLIEDNSAVRQTMHDILEIEGIICCAQLTGILLLHSIAAEKCDVLLDLMMPAMNGWQFL